MTRKIVFISILVLVILLGVLIFIPAIMKTKQPGIIKNSKSTKYTYNKSEVTDSITIYSSTYYDRKIVIDLDFQFTHGDINSVVAFDSDFQRIDKEFDCTYSFNKLTITGKDVSDISGIEIHFDDNYYDSYVKIRYLDSRQCAALRYVFADDAGYVTHDDTDLFLSESEKEAIRKRQEEMEARIEEFFKKYQGEWYVEDNDELYFKLYINERGYKVLEFAYYNDRRDIVESNFVAIDDIYYTEVNQKTYVCFLEITYCVNEFSFEIFEDNEDMIAYSNTIYTRSK